MKIFKLAPNIANFWSASSFFGDNKLSETFKVQVNFDLRKISTCKLTYTTHFWSNWVLDSPVLHTWGQKLVMLTNFINLMIKVLWFLKIHPIFLDSVDNSGKNRRKKCTVLWMPNLKLTSLTDSNQHEYCMKRPASKALWMKRSESMLYTTGTLFPDFAQIWSSLSLLKRKALKAMH